MVDADCGNVKIVKCLRLQKIFCLKNAATNNGDILLISFMIFLNCLIIILIFFTDLQPISEKVKEKNTIF